VNGSMNRVVPRPDIECRRGLGGDDGTNGRPPQLPKNAPPRVDHLLLSILILTAPTGSGPQMLLSRSTGMGEDRFQL